MSARGFTVSMQIFLQTAFEAGTRPNRPGSDRQRLSRMAGRSAPSRGRISGKYADRNPYASGRRLSGPEPPGRFASVMATSTLTTSSPTENDLYHRLAEHKQSEKERATCRFFSSEATASAFRQTANYCLPNTRNGCLSTRGRQCDETSSCCVKAALPPCLTIFTFWAYFLKDAPRARVETFFNAMTEAYKCLQTDKYKREPAQSRFPLLFTAF